MIVVCPTYNNESDRDSWDYSLAIQLTERYHNELVSGSDPGGGGQIQHLCRGTLHWKGSEHPEDHRAFCGFSMGSVATWRTFQYCLDEFSIFLCRPSGSLTTDGDFPWRLSYGIPDTAGTISLSLRPPEQMISRIPLLRPRLRRCPMWRMGPSGWLTMKRRAICTFWKKREARTAESTLWSIFIMDYAGSGSKRKGGKNKMAKKTDSRKRQAWQAGA